MEEDDAAQLSINFISCVKWIRRGVAESHPTKVQLTKQQLEDVIRQTRAHLRVGDDDEDSGTENEPPANSDTVADEFQMEAYDDEEDNRLLDLDGVVSPDDIDEEDKPDSEDEDDIIKPTDNLIVVGHVEGDASILEVFVHNEDEGSLYVHHDVLLPSIPLTMEWLNYDPENVNAAANLCAIGSMDPIIQVWDLNLVNSIEPAFKLGRKKSKKRGTPAIGHKDAVLDISWNWHLAHILASGAADKRVLLWDLEVKTPSRELKRFEKMVQSIVWHPTEGHTLLTGSADKTCKIWDCRAVDTSQSWSLDGEVERVCWNHSDPFNFVACDNLGYMHYIDSRVDSPKWSIKAHDNTIASIHLSTTIPGLLVSLSETGLLKVWDLNFCETRPSLIAEKGLKVGRSNCLDVAVESPFTIAAGGDNKSHNFVVQSLLDIEAVFGEFVSMTLSTNSTDTSTPVYLTTFNQDCTSLAVGTGKSYKLIALNSIDSLETTFEYDIEEIYIVERLFSSSLVVLVTHQAPRTLKVCHFKKKTWICHYNYTNTILASKLNRTRLVVIIDGSLFIHNIRDLQLLHTIRDTPPNPLGILQLSPSCENNFVAYPGSGNIGEVQIFDACNLHAKTMIPAHNSPLAALAFSPTGKEVATASEKGTVIRVFNVADGTKLFEFRRGVRRCVSISSLVFSTSGNYLCCSSNTETVHVFKMEDPKDAVRPETEENQGWMGLFTKAVTLSANYLPSQVTDVFSQDRAFASVHLPVQGKRSVCAITTIQKALRLLVATSDGFLYIYNLDGTDGGDCTLIKQYNLVDKEGKKAEDTLNGIPVDTVHTPPGSISTYAGILKGTSTADMSGTTESDKVREMVTALEPPPEGRFQFDDDSEFPPVTHRTE